MKSFRFFLTTVLLLLIASCTSQPTTADKKAELCRNLATLNTSIATLRSMGPNSSVGDFRKAQDNVKAAYNAVKKSTEAVQDAKVADLDRAYADLEQAMRRVPNNATMQQAAQSIQPQVAAVQAAQDQARAGLNCQ